MHNGILGLLWMSAVSLAEAGSSGVITVQGDVDSTCDIGSAPASVVELGDLASSATSGAIPFDFYCNAPFAYGLESLNGAMQRIGPPLVTTGTFNTELMYNVTAALHTDGADIKDICASTAIKAAAVTCNFTNSGDDAAIGNGVGKSGSLRFSWTQVVDEVSTPFLAGAYADRLILTISIRP